MSRLCSGKTGKVLAACKDMERSMSSLGKPSRVLECLQRNRVGDSTRKGAQDQSQGERFDPGTWRVWRNATWEGGSGGSNLH